MFRRVVAEVQRGLEVDGEPITGSILVDLGPEDRLQVDTAIELDVVEETISELAVDLHTARWLRRLDRDLRQVDRAHFEEELRLRHHR